MGGPAYWARRGLTTGARIPLADRRKRRNNGASAQSAQEVRAMTNEQAQGFGFAPAHDAPIPYMQRIRDYYVALGYGAPYEWAHYAQGAVPALDASRWRRAASRIVTTAAPYQPDKGDQGPGAPYNSAAKFYTVYSGDTAQGPRPAHLARRHRPQAHDGRGPRHLVPAARAAPRRQARPHRLGRAALSRPADQPQPSRDARGRLPGGRGPLQGRRRRCGHPRRQLPRLPPEHRASPPARWRRPASPPW